MEQTLPARVQFALTISYHYIYPPITIGLGLILVVLGVLYLRTGNPDDMGTVKIDAEKQRRQLDGRDKVTPPRAPTRPDGPGRNPGRNPGRRPDRNPG